MKKLLFVAALMVSALGAMAQGTVTFKNTTALANPVFDTDGATKLGDAAYQAQLVWSATSSGTFAVAKMSDGTTDSAAAPFRTGAGAGFWNPGADAVRVAGVAAGTAGFFKVQVWNPADGTFAQAKAKAGAKWGESAVFSVTTGGAGSPPSLPADFTTLTSFSLKLNPNVPEPSTIALGLIGAGALLLRRRN